MIVAIHQPNYIPWLGYFRKVVACDTFVFFDNVQMPMGKSYVSRSQVKLSTGAHWLTVPTEKRGAPGLIRETKIVAGSWPRKHLATLASAYGGSPYLEQLLPMLKRCFAQGHEMIADLNIEIIGAICELLVPGKVRFVRASAMQHGRTGAESILPILTELGATTYLTGAGAGSMRYIEPHDLRLHGIETRFVSYDFPEYRQRHGAFVAGLSAIDALLNCGPRKLLDVLRG